MTDKNFEKIKIKIVMNIQQCTPPGNFSHFVELHIMGANLPKKTWPTKNLKKINIKIEISICQSTPVPNFSQLEELQILGPNLPKKHEWKEF